MFQPLFVRPLTKSENEGLRRYSASQNREEATRASVILMSCQGKTAAEISDSTGSHPSNVKKWIRKFNSDGLEAISSKKRGPQGGPQPRFNSDQIEQLLQLSQVSPSDLGYRFLDWTPQKLATAAIERGIVDKISHVTVRQILKRKAEANGSHKQPGTSTARSEPLLDSKEFDKGKADLARSAYESAAAHFYAALTENDLSADEEAETRSLLSKALEELSKYDEAYSVIGKYDDPRTLGSLLPRTRARVRLRLGWVSSFLRNHPKAIATLNEARRLFIELGDDLGTSEANNALGRAYIAINEYRIARDHLLAAANIQKTALDRELLADIYRRLGNVDFLEGLFTNSKQDCLKALELAEGSTNSNLVGNILLDLGTTMIYGSPAETRESIKYLERGIEYLEKGGHKDYLANALNSLGHQLWRLGLWKQAIENLNKAIDIGQRFAKPGHEATARITLAEIVSAKGS